LFIFKKKGDILRQRQGRVYRRTNNGKLRCYLLRIFYRYYSENKKCYCVARANY